MSGSGRGRFFPTPGKEPKEAAFALPGLAIFLPWDCYIKGKRNCYIKEKKPHIAPGRFVPPAGVCRSAMLPRPASQRRVSWGFRFHSGLILAFCARKLRRIVSRLLTNYPRMRSKRERTSITAALFIHFRIIGSAEQVIDGDIEIIGKKDQRFIIGFALAVFIAAYAVLRHVEVKGELLPGDPAFAAQF